MRFNRFNSLLSNETKKYFKYGLGEVVLVVIGILLALQVNNWNENRKLVNEEKKTLLSFHNEVSNNLKILERSIIEKQYIVEANREILKYTGPNKKWLSDKSLDSLMYHITVSGWIFVPEDGVLNEIASLPQLISLILEEDRLYRDDLHEYFLPFFSKNYRLRNITSHRDLLEHSESDLDVSKFKNNSEKILNNPEFENILTIQSIWIKFSIDMCINQKSKYLEIQRLIEKKYPDVDYSELQENLDRGFWG